jgi:hypothetical protein
MRGPAPAELLIYSGRDYLGRIEVAVNGTARAFDYWGKNLGAFANVADAQRAFDAPNEGRVKQRRRRHAVSRGKSVAKRPRC